MTPNEWQDWIKGARERELDKLEYNLHLATANAMAKSKKGVKPMFKQIARERENLTKNVQQIKYDKHKVIEQRKSLRQRQIDEAEALFFKKKGE